MYLDLVCISQDKLSIHLPSKYLVSYGCTVARSSTEDDSSILIKKDTLENMEHEIIATFLDDNRWNRSEVAKKLGISRSTLWRKYNNV